MVWEDLATQKLQSQSENPRMVGDRDTPVSLCSLLLQQDPPEQGGAQHHGQRLWEIPREETPQLSAPRARPLTPSQHSMGGGNSEDEFE